MDDTYPIVDYKMQGYGYNVIMKSENLDDITKLVDILFEEIDINKVKFRDYLIEHSIDADSIRWSVGIIFLRNGCCQNRLERKIFSCVECFRKHYLNCIEKSKK